MEESLSPGERMGKNVLKGNQALIRVVERRYRPAAVGSGTRAGPVAGRSGGRAAAAPAVPA
jgi:hypothetical protein